MLEDMERELIELRAKEISRETTEKLLSSLKSDLLIRLDKIDARIDSQVTRDSFYELYKAAKNRYHTEAIHNISKANATLKLIWSGIKNVAIVGLLLYTILSKVPIFSRLIGGL